MKKLFLSTAQLDSAAISAGLIELVLQENAARALVCQIKKNLKPSSKLLFLCGAGNNAADGIAAARMLSGDYNCELLLLFSKLNDNALTQLNIAKNYGVRVLNSLDLSKDLACYDGVIDSIFGSGLKRDMSENICELISAINEIHAFKLAVDVPSGLDSDGNLRPLCFKADITVTMGALKLGLYSDNAKDFAGKITLAGLGLSEQNFTSKAQECDYLLELSDMRLPYRTRENVNKGDFGHAFVVRGDMSGAAQITALAALNMGVGKISLYNCDLRNLEHCDPVIMQKTSFEGASAVACGMGLGSAKLDFSAFLSLPCVIDADMFKQAKVLEFAKSLKCVLTPHPKEFASLLKLSGLGEFSAAQINERRFNLAREFSTKFPCVLVLKGANTIIAHNGVLYICANGSSKLAVGGSGDTLAGIILALLAQGYNSLDAAITGVLAHAKTALNYDKSDFSFTPNDIIKGLKNL